MKKFLIPLFLIIAILPDASGQLWMRERQFVFLGMGATGFMGDLGGADKVGTQDFRDFNFRAIRPATKIGYRYFVNYDLAVTGNLAFGYVSGDDRHTQEPFRNNRNLMFRSPVLETSVQGEWFFYTDGKVGARYRDQTRNIGWIGFRLRGYVFAGIGAFYFSPQGYFNGSHYLTLNHASIAPENLPRDGWYNLRPLSTEGQGFEEFPSRKKYMPFNLAIPFGIGMTLSLSREWSIGLEYGFRKTFTDYLDDASTTYVDPRVFTVQFDGNPSKIALGEYFSNPTNYSIQNHQPGYDSTLPGYQRANPHNDDAYMFLFFTVQYKIISGPTSRRWAPIIR
jgi:hypothetical protein